MVGLLTRLLYTYHDIMGRRLARFRFVFLRTGIDGVTFHELREIFHAATSTFYAD